VHGGSRHPGKRQGNADQGGRRQITIIEEEVFDRIRRNLPDVEPAMRRANLMVSGVGLEESRGRVLAVGSVRVLIQGETRPCERMDAQCPGLTTSLRANWHGGAYGTILEGGVIRLGDAVSLEEATP
jgi:MOSC domain-containing protein YiiM